MRIALVTLLLFSASLAVTTSVAQQTTFPAEPPSQSAEAYKHYLIALEALKTDDLDEAFGQLKQAASLAPRNALVRYNIALVESKRGKPREARVDLLQAKKLGLPANLQNEVDELDAKLSYDALRSQRGETLANIRQLLIGVAFTCESNSDDSHIIYGFNYHDISVDPVSSSVRYIEDEETVLKMKIGMDTVVSRPFDYSLRDVVQIESGTLASQDYCQHQDRGFVSNDPLRTLHEIRLRLKAAVPSSGCQRSDIFDHDRRVKVGKPICASGTLNEIAVKFGDKENADRFAADVSKLMSVN